MDTTAAEAAGGLKFCDHYGDMSYADFLAYAARQAAAPGGSYDISVSSAAAPLAMAAA